MTRLRATLVLLTCSLACWLLLAGSPGQALAQERTSFKIAWSIYVGWMPWAYADEMGILDKWAEKYGIEIELTLINDYVESINLYTAGRYRRLRHDQHGCAHHPGGRRRRHAPR